MQRYKEKSNYQKKSVIFSNNLDFRLIYTNFVADYIEKTAKHHEFEA
jgi:hypothetical protein